MALWNKKLSTADGPLFVAEPNALPPLIPADQGQSRNHLHGAIGEVPGEESGYGNEEKGKKIRYLSKVTGDSCKSMGWGTSKQGYLKREQSINKYGYE